MDMFGLRNVLNGKETKQLSIYKPSIHVATIYDIY